MAHPQLHEILFKYRKGLAEALGDKLDSVLLYGSQARGDARGELSDIDVIILMREAFDYGEAMDRTSELTAQLSLQHDTVISRVFVSREDFETCRLPFYENVRREGIAV